MKRIKSLCIVLVLALFAAYMPVQAAKQDDTMIKMQQKDAGQVELALYPNGDMIKKPCYNIPDPNEDNRD